MKSHIRAILVLAASAFAVAHAAAAQVGSVYTQYDYNLVNGSPASNQELTIGAQVNTPVGKFDADMVGDWINHAADQGWIGEHGDTASHGPEFGYSNGLSLGPVAVQGRLAWGRTNHYTHGDASVGGDHHYFSLGAQADVKLMDGLGIYGSYRYRSGTQSNHESDNRYVAGVSYAVTPSIDVRGGYSVTKAFGQSWHGVSTAASFAF